MSDIHPTHPTQTAAWMKRVLDDERDGGFPAGTGSPKLAPREAPSADFRFLPGDTALLPNAAAAFLHIKVTNHGRFAPRVRGWVRFRRVDDGADACPGGDMPIRWSSRPEPVTPIPVGQKDDTTTVVWLPDPSKSIDADVMDFAENESRLFAFAVKLDDGTSWGWTQASYFHEWRHASWPLPLVRLHAEIRLLANGREYSSTFVFDPSDDLESIVVSAEDGRSGERGEPATTMVNSEQVINLAARKSARDRASASRPPRVRTGER